MEAELLVGFTCRLVCGVDDAVAIDWKVRRELLGDDVDGMGFSSSGQGRLQCVH